MNIRIKNLELRKASYLGEEPKHPSYHIDIWKKNDMYQKESEYIQDGDYYIDPEHPNCYHHKNCFTNAEYCYSIASFDYDDEGFYELHFVGDRPFEEKDIKETFWLIAELGNKILNHGGDIEDSEGE